MRVIRNILYPPILWLMVYLAGNFRINLESPTVFLWQIHHRHLWVSHRSHHGDMADYRHDEKRRTIFTIAGYWFPSMQRMLQELFI